MRAAVGVPGWDNEESGAHGGFARTVVIDCQAPGRCAEQELAAMDMKWEFTLDNGNRTLIKRKKFEG